MTSDRDYAWRSFMRSVSAYMFGSVFGIVWCAVLTWVVWPSHPDPLNIRNFLMWGITTSVVVGLNTVFLLLDYRTYLKRCGD